jgi:hypothetical protein
VKSIDQRSLRLRGCQGARRTLAALDAALRVGTVLAPEQGTEDRQPAPRALSLAFGLHAVCQG